MNINATALDQNKVHTYVTPAKGSTVVGGSVEPTVYSLWSGDATNVTASYYWPTLQLRKSGSDGYTSNPFKALWGIRPTISANSTFKDPDYGDYLRRFNSANYDNGNGSSLNENVQYSFIFSLDDIVIGTGTDVYHLSGSRVGGTSYSAMSGISELLDKDVRQFVFPLYGGFDGLDITEKEPFNNTVVGESADPAANYTIYTLNKAIDSVSDPDNVGASMMIVPGIWQPSVTNRLINVCENRADSLAIIDIENDYTPKTEDTSSAEDRRGNVNSAVSAMKTRNFNTSYACCFYPWVQVTDNLNSGERVWVPSSIAGLGAMAQTQARSELWFAPAGFNRGGLGNLGGMQGPRVVQARQRLDQSERDKLYDANINPIATFPNEGVVIFGQKTLQATPSALDRINVRRLMLYLKSQVGHIARNLLFDQNVTSTWARFKGKVEPILADVQSRFGITEYKLVLDETTTTDDLIDRNIMYAKIFLKPARAIEYIVVDFVITRTGAEFT
jgi:phage tail sheath protein FI